ncbi:MAG TPA: prenyltransferase/squalene oxidase repeat-containing protein, partial [Verrucomicrobiae bacterium]|nr:prenyltransferase/squalene oxidase repeat-containing protein [Verrucomicrobiae bacterium]
MNFHSRLRAAMTLARATLLEARNAQGHWTGELSSSPLSTATAVCALAVAGQQASSSSVPATAQISRGLDWLAANMNADGGWGDTSLSVSNISTTTLCWAVFGVVPGAEEKYRAIVHGAERWLRQRAGSLAPGPLAAAIIQRYGNDRTFSVPILTTCALAGRLGAPREAWSQIIPLPFELAVCPPEWFAALRLPVVSYALPALIAMGVARHRHRPSRNPVARLVRNLTERRAMAVLGKIQPDNGGFLEATPLTSFVVMSLAASGYAEHAVTRKGVEFLLASARPDGSWPIDTNLATWLTTLAVNALGLDAREVLSAQELGSIREWLLRQQYRERHPYTNAPPGGWAWTNLPGGVPDADDTAGALLALRNLGAIDERAREAGRAGIGWLLNLQNSDGGVPTFCRGWGKLPFDQSSADLTAHAMRAWAAWLPDLLPKQQRRVLKALAQAGRFLKSNQEQESNPAGGWKPLWFGDQHGQDEINWTYGTSRVLLALSMTALQAGVETRIHAAAHWLVKTQRSDGGWGGGHSGGESSVEETALAVEALASLLENHGGKVSEVHSDEIQSAMTKGVSWLIGHIENGSWIKPAPIGFYFAKLCYFERLYPVIFTVGALGRAARVLR